MFGASAFLFWRMCVEKPLTCVGGCAVSDSGPHASGFPGLLDLPNVKDEPRPQRA
jgi:hypothetical protein